MAHPLTFFLCAHSGEGLSLALRLRREGHAVSYYTPDNPRSPVGQGLIDRPLGLNPPRGATVIFTDTGFERLGRQLRARGFSVLGANVAESWETDRRIGSTIMQACGIEVPPTYTFPTIRVAQAFLAREPDGAWVFKPDDAPRSVTRNAPSNESMIRFLGWAESHVTSKRFLLQRAVRGTEVAVDVWLSHGAVVGPHYVDLDSDGGSNVVFAVDENEALVQQTIGRCIAPLLATDYCGCASVNVILEPGGSVYGLEFTNRLGYYALEAWMSLIPDRLGEQLAEFTAGNLRTWDTDPSRPFAMTLRVSTATENAADLAQLRGMPIDPRVLDDEQFYPHDVMLDAQGLPAFAGISGCAGVLVETGPVIGHLRHLLLERAEALDIPAIQYQVDLCGSAESQLDALVRLNLLDRESEFEVPSFDFRDELANVTAQQYAAKRDDESEDPLSPGDEERTAGYLPDPHMPSTSVMAEVAGPGAMGPGNSTVSPGSSTATPGP